MKKLKISFASLKNLYLVSQETAIKDAYLLVLDRLPDPSGGGHYYEELRTGRLSITRLVMGLISSEEAKLKGRSVTGFNSVVIALYLKLLDSYVSPSKPRISLTPVAKKNRDTSSPKPAEHSVVPREFTVEKLKSSEVLQFCVNQKLFSSTSEYHTLYGIMEGYEVLRSLAKNPAKNVIILCPSFGKQCGIGEYAEHLRTSLVANGLSVVCVRRSEECFSLPQDFLTDSALIVNHGPGLFDGYNRTLSEGESTLGLLANLNLLKKNHGVRPILYLHSLLREDNHDMYGRQYALLHSGIPVVTTITSASEYFRIAQIEHGVQPVPASTSIQCSQISKLTTDNLKIGFFGFFQWGGKDMDALLSAVRQLKATLVGSVAISSEDDIVKLRELLSKGDVHCNLNAGWATSEHLCERLAEADVYYMPQKDYDHWNNSGSARLAANFGKPVFVPPHQPFLDLADSVSFVEESDIARVISSHSSSRIYTEACAAISRFTKESSMKNTAKQLCRGDLYDRLMQVNANSFLEPNVFTFQRMLNIGSDIQSYRTPSGAYVTTDLIAGNENQLYSAMAEPQNFFLFNLQVVPSVNVWRRHYLFSDFVYKNPADVAYNGYRCILKRDPSAIEMIAAVKQLLNGRSPKAKHVCVRQIARFLASLMQIPLDFIPKVRILHGDKEIQAFDFNQGEWSDLQGRVDSTFDKCIARRAAFDAVNTDCGGRTEYNIFALLILPFHVLAKRLNALLSTDGAQVDVGAFLSEGTLRQKYQSLLLGCAELGIDLNSRCIMDAPTPPAIDYFKSYYYFSELALFNGDAFLINMFRCLEKREPFAFELIRLRETLADKGKHRLLTDFARARFSNGIVYDMNTVNPYNEVTVESPELSRLIHDFRDPCAGGRIKRNRYLLDKRGLARTWLRLKEAEKFCLNDLKLEEFKEQIDGLGAFLF